MINLAGPIQGVKKEKNRFTFRVADTSIAVLPRKKALYKITEQLKSGVWVSVRAESAFTSSGDHIYDAKDIKITAGTNTTPKS